MIKFLALFCFVVVVVSSTSQVSADEPAGRQQALRLDRQIKVELDYLLYLPENYDSQDSWPLLLFLHGAGERGDNLELVKKHGPPKLISAGKNFPFLVVSPQCAKDERWEPIELLALIDQVLEDHNVDQDRIYVSGLSMGGFGTWELAAYAPDRLAAIVPICGGGESRWARRFARLPTWVFHGAKDRAVPLERSQVMVDALRRAGGDPKFTVYPEAEHDSWTESYLNDELYKWMLSQKRASQP